MDLRFDLLFAGFSAVKCAMYSPASSSPTSTNIGGIRDPCRFWMFYSVGPQPHKQIVRSHHVGTASHGAARDAPNR